MQLFKLEERTLLDNGYPSAFIRMYSPNLTLRNIQTGPKSRPTTFIVQRLKTVVPPAFLSVESRVIFNTKSVLVRPLKDRGPCRVRQGHLLIQCFSTFFLFRPFASSSTFQTHAYTHRLIHYLL